MNDTLTPDFVERKARISHELALLFLNGVTQKDLTDFLRIDGEAEQVTTLRRMNTVGNLRGVGFDVTGGRRGGKTYRILSWTDPASVERPTIESFDSDQLTILDEVLSKERLTTAQADIDRLFHRLWGALAQSSIDGRAHEKSILQLLCYDVSKTSAYVIDDGGMGLILRKNVSTPNWKLIPLTLSFDSTIEWAQKLRRISFKPVKILYIPPEWKAEMKTFGFSPESAAEALYDLDFFANHPGRYLSKQSLKSLRRVERETQLHEVEWGADSLGADVIEQWKIANEPRQRRLSIARDYFSLLIGLRSKMTFLGMRWGMPVCLHVLDSVCGPLADKVVCQVTEKSLNYRVSPGGLSGTSDFNLWSTANRLLAKGFTTMNTGHIYGGEQGLADRKKRLATEIITIESTVVPLDPFFGGSK